MTAPLRIAHVTPSYPPYVGGVGNVVRAQARELTARGHSVEIFTHSGKVGRAADNGAIDDGELTVHRDRPLLKMGHAALLPGLSRLGHGESRQFDVIHLHHPFIGGTEMVLLGNRGADRPALVSTVHNRLLDAGYKKPLFAYYEAVWSPALMRRADKVLALSEPHAESVPYLRKARKRHPEKIAHLPNGADLRRFAPGEDRGGLRERLGIADDAVLAAFVGALDRDHPHKRLDLAIEAVAASERPQLEMVVAGGGNMLEHYRGLAADAGLAERVHFLGSIDSDEIPDVLRAADLMVLTTQPAEAFPLALVEGMASGLPVVTTDFPGVSAIVERDRNALVGPVGDVSAASANLRRMVDAGPDRRREIGAAGRARCEADLSWPRVVDRLEGIYAETIAARQAEAA